MRQFFIKHGSFIGNFVFYICAVIYNIGLPFAVWKGLVWLLDYLKAAKEAKAAAASASKSSDPISPKNCSPIESFTINFENIQNLLFDNLTFNILFNFFLIIIFFNLIVHSSLTMFSSLNLIKNCFKIYNFFFLLFKNLITNVRFERFFYFLLVIFIYILFANLGGLSLYELSFTSHAILALFLSFIIFFNYLVNYLINFNESSYKKFVQNNLNIALIVVLFFIELISFFVRPFSLGIRLFANILSGHILIHIFFGAFIHIYKFIFWLSILLFLFCIFILFMEIFVSCVQAYIFFILSLIYMQDVAKLHL